MRVAVLTKSDKNEELCVAGIDIETGNFVRLVSSDPQSHYAIPHECMKNVNVLDVIEVSVLRHMPSYCQQENFEVKLQKWESIVNISVDRLLPFVNNGSPYIFSDNCFYLDEEIAQKLTYSIMMIQVRSLSISRNQYDKTKACFCYNGVWYSNMSITDPDYYNQNITMEKALLVISIPDIGYASPHYVGKRCYKFISKIFEI